jgi:hypothetical protein
MARLCGVMQFMGYTLEVGSPIFEATDRRWDVRGVPSDGPD